MEQSRTAKGVFRATNVAGQEILRGTVRSEIAGWLVSATVQLAHLEASRRRGQMFAVAMMATALGLGAALAYMFATFMARPLQAATNAAAAVGRGEQCRALHRRWWRRTPSLAALSAASSELKRRQEHSAFLMRELAHRSKNLLAVVKGMAMQTARQTRTWTNSWRIRLSALTGWRDRKTSWCSRTGREHGSATSSAPI